ncbi:hypothetical protein AAV94_00910 [Lampropedia cohaerens]|uniref:Ribosomal silencing factor RsfS n=1 Tax=Lampropedia cohaerens TaxID=1610491 RepID=A0A0U1Q2P1_9BURK|nr:ribosome silencing factor [Lampropedia cohaerens]KKW69011.1 hypothetical protein AAV94_00910 [Lampropedia cohaerens]
MKTTSETAAKRQITQLQTAIIEGLEDIKAVDIQVFDTTELSPLFERVIIASANSSRQTRALAASVRDKVRDAGFDKPRMEGEDNGEWVIVDCGTVVAHIMQPTIRAYYRLEEIWGDKPVRKPAVRKKAAAVSADADGGGAAAAQTAKPAVKRPAKAAAKKAAAPSTSAKAAGSKPVAAKKTAKTVAVKASAAAKKAPARKTAAKNAAG